VPELTASRPKVLIVEDDTMLAWNLEYLVQNAGYDVVGPTGHLKDAVKLAQTSEIDAALLDIRLAQDELVFPAAEVLKKRGVPFIFTTAFSREVARTNGYKEPTLLKPLDRSVIEKMIKYLTQAPPPVAPRRARPPPAPTK
jgi:DNA-binding response OmpR family regulator